MATTTKKPQKPKKSPGKPVSNNDTSEVLVTDAILTLAEAATYLRLPETEVTRLVQTQGLPGQPVGADWRFLKSAIQAWLSSPPAKAHGQGIWAMAGSWKDDPDLDEMLDEIYRRRGRSMTEET